MHEKMFIAADVARSWGRRRARTKQEACVSAARALRQKGCIPCSGRGLLPVPTMELNALDYHLRVWTIGSPEENSSMPTNEASGSARTIKRT